MKSTITILSLCLCFLWSCQTEPAATADSGTEKESTVPTTTEAPVHTLSEKAAPMVGMWHCAVVMGRPDEMETYKGRWINLKRDDTFISGKWLDETNSGTWSYNDEMDMIVLSYKEKEDEELYTNWKTQGDGEIFIWKGSTELNTTGIQIKMKKYLDMSRPGK